MSGQSGDKQGPGENPPHQHPPEVVEFMTALAQLHRAGQQGQAAGDQPFPAPNMPASNPPAPNAPAPVPVVVARTPTPPPHPITPAQVQAEMGGALRYFVRYSLLTTTFTPTHYNRVAQVANRLGGRPALQDALVALDHADWDLGGAIQQLEHDYELSQEADNNSPPTGPDANRLLDRTRASGGPNWDKTKLQLRIRTGTRWKTRDFRDVDIKFNINEPSPMEILRLNRWRHSIILDLAGPPRRPGGEQAGDWWNAITTRDIRRRYLEKVDIDYKSPGYGDIAKAHNEAFRGLMLPGEVTEVPQRGYQQVASLVKREWKNDKYRHRGLRIQAKKARSLLKKQEKKDRKRAEKTAAVDFSSTLEMLQRLEEPEEMLILETDTEEDEIDEEDE